MTGEDLSAWAQLWRTIDQYPVLTPEQEQQLVAQFHTPQEAEALDRLVKCNLRLVRTVVTKAQQRYNIHDDQSMDLVSEGLWALWRCLPKYDPTILNDQGKPNKISTYAYKWVERAVIKEATRIKHLIRSSDQTVLSLDTPIGSEEDGSLYDVLPDENAEEMTVEESQDWKELARFLEREVGRRVARMMLMRFGIPDGKIRTLEEVAQQFGKGPYYEGLTRESIRQWEKRFYALMSSHPKYKQWLNDRT